MGGPLGGGGKALSLKPQTAEERNLLIMQLSSIAGFVALNIGLNEFNSFALKKPPAQPGFNYPVFYTMFHMIASCLGVTVIMCFKPPRRAAANETRALWAALELPR